MLIFLNNNNGKLTIMPNITEDQRPKDLDEAVQILKDSLLPADPPTQKESDEEYIKSHKEQPPLMHHGFGMHLRNTWALWNRTTPLTEWFISTHGLGHADDISSIVINSFWCSVRNEPYDITKDVERCKKHWTRLGVDPITILPVEHSASVLRGIDQAKRGEYSNDPPNVEADLLEFYNE